MLVRSRSKAFYTYGAGITRSVTLKIDSNKAYLANNERHIRRSLVTEKAPDALFQRRCRLHLALSNAFRNEEKP